MCVITCLVPRRLSLYENVHAKEGGKETTICTLPMVPCGSSPVTRVSRLPLWCEQLSGDQIFRLATGPFSNLRPGSAVWKESKWGEIGKISPSGEEADFFSFCPQCWAWCQANLSPVQIPIVCGFYSFDNLRNLERLKLKFFCTALVLNLCKFPKFICLTDIEFEVI